MKAFSGGSLSFFVLLPFSTFSPNVNKHQLKRIHRTTMQPRPYRKQVQAWGKPWKIALQQPPLSHMLMLKQFQILSIQHVKTQAFSYFYTCFRNPFHMPPSRLPFTGLAPPKSSACTHPRLKRAETREIFPVKLLLSSNFIVQGFPETSNHAQHPQIREEKLKPNKNIYLQKSFWLATLLKHAVSEKKGSPPTLASWEHGRALEEGS